MNYFQNIRHFSDRVNIPYLLFWVAFIVLLLLYALQPISDPDFWWHLKTGDLIIQKQWLLDSDPFNYTSDNILRSFQAVTLRGYWLWQVITSLLFSAFGFAGIFLLKIATAALLFWAVFLAARRQRLSVFTMIALAAPGTLLVINVFRLERPQVFSFFFATLLVGMIARIRSGACPSPLIVPLMTFWANTHPGFVIGDIMLLLALAGFLLQYRHDRSRQLLTATWAVAGVLASLINPCGWNAFVSLFNAVQHPVRSFDVVEYQSSLKLFLFHSKVAALCLWSLATINCAGLLLAPRRFWPEIFVALFIIVTGLAYIRNAGFIAISLLPMTGWYLEQGYARLSGKSFRYLRAAACILLVLVFSWLAMKEIRMRKTAPPLIANKFPLAMADFLRDSGLSGQLFNDYNSGGYLDWALYPQWKTFIDGRNLDPRISGQYLKLAFGAREPVEGKPCYQQLLDHYRIDVVALLTAFPDGRIQPLLKLLLNDPQWMPVFLDNQSFVIARNTSQNATAISKWGIDKSSFLKILTSQINNHVRNSPESIQHAVMYADILGYQGKLLERDIILKKLENTRMNPEMLHYLKKQQRPGESQ